MDQKEMKKLEWDLIALNNFKKAIKHIAKDSTANAEKVRVDILKALEKVSRYPEFYPPDRYKNDNKRAFRSFELYRFRISYHVSEVEIRVVQFRHSKMKPKAY
jgi:plasmid stabilization system protein ParE